METNLENLTMGTAEDLFADFPELAEISDFVIEKENSRRGEPIYLIINERNCGGYDIYLNEQFNVAGGRKLNTIGMATLKEARDFCEKWKYELAKNRHCVHTTYFYEDGTKEKVRYEPIPYEQLMEKVSRYEVVEYVSPTVQYPDKVYYPVEKPKPKIPPNAAKHHDSKLFKWYLGACKKNLRAHQFVSIVARSLNRKVSRQLTIQLVTALERLSAAATVNPKMQALIKANFGTTEFPKLIGAIQIPSIGKNYK